MGAFSVALNAWERQSAGVRGRHVNVLNRADATVGMDETGASLGRTPSAITEVQE